MSYKLGFNGKLYYDSGTTFTTPTWVECPNVEDVTLNLEANEITLQTRAGNGWETSVPSTFKSSVSFKMVYDPADAAFTAFRVAFLTRAPIHVAIMDGPVATAGSQGLQAVMMVSKFPRDEPYAGAMTVDVEIKPTYYPSLPPQWVIAS